MNNVKPKLHHFSGIGQRKNNEDNYTIIEDKENTLLLVCDGMGGAEKGEVASELVCKAITKSFPSYKDVFKPQSIYELVRIAQDSLDNYVLEHSECKGMGTTLAMAWVCKNKVMIAHCGDSKVFIWNQKGLIYKTLDHSYVNELIKRGMLSESEAENHPKKNVITRALQGNVTNKSESEVKIIEAKEKVALFLCSDGVLDSFSEKSLLQTLLDMHDSKGTFDHIMNTCKTTSKDNYTAILYEQQTEPEPSVWESIKSIFN